MSTKINSKTTPIEIIISEFLCAINSDLSLESAVKNVLSNLVKVFDSAAATIILFDLRDYSLHSFYLRDDNHNEIKAIPFECNQDFLDWNSGNRSPIISNDLEKDNNYQASIGSCPGVIPRNLISVPLFAGGEYFGTVQVFNTRFEGDFADSDLKLLKILGQHIAQTLRNSWILDEAISGSREAKSLYEVGIALSSSLDLDEVLDKILASLHRVIECNMAVILLVDNRDGSIRHVRSSGVPPGMTDKLDLKLGEGIIGRVVRTGKGTIVSDVSADPDYSLFRHETKSEMAVPLKVGETVIGTFNIESDKPKAYHEHDLDLLNAFASLAAITIERAKLEDERMASRKLAYELSIARRIQMTFLPSEDPKIDGFDISGINIPSAAVGGDYYDFIPIVENQLGVAIGDVSGKGIPASLIMAAFRASLKAEIRNNFAIRTVLFKVNNLLFESLERDNYVTAIYGVLDSKNRIFTFSNAGHNPPILRRVDGTVEYLKEGGLVLGAFADSKYEERPLYLNHGDILLFYTDGITEAKNADDEEFGMDRVLAGLEEVKDGSAADIIEYIIGLTKKFASEDAEMDDLTMVAIKAL